MLEYLIITLSLVVMAPGIGWAEKIPCENPQACIRKEAYRASTNQIVLSLIRALNK